MRISFTADSELVDMLEQVKQLLFASGTGKRVKLEQVFKRVLREYLQKHCPEERQKRREARQKKQEEMILPKY